MKRLFEAALAAVAIMIMQACATRTAPVFSDRLAEADAALADGNYERAQDMANEMLEIAMTADSDAVGETESAHLGLLFMKLSEKQHEDENVADATQCIRRAFRLSGDSLKAFFASLPLEDTPRFVLLRRIGLSIDNPVEQISETDSEVELDSIH